MVLRSKLREKGEWHEANACRCPPAALRLAWPAAFAASNPSGTGPPTQSCEAQPTGPPGFDAAGFANAQSHYNPGSQYDATPLAPFRDGLGRPSRPGPFGGSRPAYRITRTLSRTASAVRSRAAAPSLTNTWNSRRWWGRASDSMLAQATIAARRAVKGRRRRCRLHAPRRVPLGGSARGHRHTLFASVGSENRRRRPEALEGAVDAEE